MAISEDLQQLDAQPDAPPTALTSRQAAADLSASAGDPQLVTRRVTWSRDSSTEALYGGGGGGGTGGGDGGNGGDGDGGNGGDDGSGGGGDDDGGGGDGDDGGGGGGGDGGNGAAQLPRPPAAQECKNLPASFPPILRRRISTGFLSPPRPSAKILSLAAKPPRPPSILSRGMSAFDGMLSSSSRQGSGSSRMSAQGEESLEPIQTVFR